MLHARGLNLVAVDNEPIETVMVRSKAKLEHPTQAQAEIESVATLGRGNL